MQESTFAQYRGKRDYRAIIFSCKKLETNEQVIRLFDGDLLFNGEEAGLSSLNGDNIRGIRAIYRSETCFLRTSDEQKKEALKVARNGNLYEYELCVLAYKRGKKTVFMVAVPFSSMAREVFGKIHAAKPSADFRYLRPTLSGLISSLLDTQSKLSRIRTIGINWSVAGDTGRSDQITIRGADVIHSTAFRYLRAPNTKISLSLRKVQIVHEGFGGKRKLKMTFDQFGNYGIWAMQDASNLPDVFRVFELFVKCDLIESEPAFPVRNREDEPLMP